MNIIDGKALAEEIKNDIVRRVKALPAPVTLGVLSCNPNFETQKYLALKKKTAESLGILLEVDIVPLSFDTEACVAEVKKLSAQYDGVIVQLPLPRHIDTEKVLLAVPSTHDVDVFRYQGETTVVLPPVIGAINEIATTYQVSFANRSVVIFGSGRLVGTPARFYAESLGAHVTVITPKTEYTQLLAATKEADIIILGVGKPGLLTPEMVKEGVLVFDAGASEDGGLLVGDALPSVAQKAALFTPVPGGIGPLTVVLLFRNLLELAKRQ